MAVSIGDITISVPKKGQIQIDQVESDAVIITDELTMRQLAWVIIGMTESTKKETS